LQLTGFVLFGNDSVHVDDCDVAAVCRDRFGNFFPESRITPSSHFDAASGAETTEQPARRPHVNQIPEEKRHAQKKIAAPFFLNRRELLRLLGIGTGALAAGQLLGSPEPLRLGAADD